jgi:adenosylmethionine-8-amino-7-oxononanoate aminotransferase
MNVDAEAARARQFSHFHSYAGHSTEAMAVLLDRLIRKADMGKVFYGLSGPDADVDITREAIAEITGELTRERAI